MKAFADNKIRASEKLKFINPFPNKPWFLRVCSTSLLKICGKRRNCSHNKQFLLFPQCFLPFHKTFHHFHQLQNCHLQTLSVWESPKFVVWESPKFVVWERIKGRVENTVGKAFSPFPIVFKRLLSQGH